jgi:hypothetical protein
MAELTNGVTSINDLPTDPSGGGSIGGNISMITQEIGINEQNSQINQNQLNSLDQSTISQIVNGLQQASYTGATQLPSRDLPMDTTGLTRDEQVQPNYIPPPKNQDYINDSNDINDYLRKEAIDNSLDSFYDEFQTPLLLAILYFIFQLPVFKKFLFNYLPSLFLKDGNYNIYGLIFSSALYALIYYIVSKSVKNLSRI